ncbi:MAG: DUF4037 domain-containing protein [Trichormus sp. ATA11-4-KO1]|jgi:predicted nucleotidyltransferase|nr:DUF4037 domain-containing protein [Trichormus sp. ATA11-4-KO1]
MFNFNVLSLAEQITAEFKYLPQVVAVVLAGSQTNQAADPASDLDFYVYVSEEITLEIREAIAQKFADRVEINNQFWEPGDEWVDRDSGRRVDIMYRMTDWSKNQLDRILIHHQASIGYSTCFWFNVCHSLPLYDPDGWFQQLQQQAKQPYPQPLVEAIIAKNYPILRKNFSSYAHQMELAIQRNDLVSLNHRTAALIASYFDIIFAVNQTPHPGEKRLLQLTKKLCSELPTNMEDTVNNLFFALFAGRNLYIIAYVNRLVDGLDQLLMTKGFTAIVNS